MKKQLTIQNVGVAVDASFPGTDGNQVQAYQIPVTAMVDGVVQNTNIKIFGKGGDQKIKQGITVTGDFNQQYNTYTVKKGDNPSLFGSSGGYENKKFGGGKFVNYELEALKASIEIFKLCPEIASKLPTAEAITEAILENARTKIIPFLRAGSNRHDVKTEVDNAKNMKAQAIRNIIQTNGLVDIVRNNSLTNSFLAAEYEAAGSDGGVFVRNLLAKYGNSQPASAPTCVGADEDDDVPF